MTAATTHAYTDAATESPVDVAIVDDHPVTRDGLAALVAQIPGFRVRQAVSDPEHLSTVPRPDLVVHDLYLADGKPAVASVARAVADGSRVVVVSASRDPADVLAAVSAGASGYVCKDSDTSFLKAALITTASGGFALSPQLADILVAGLAAARVSEDRTKALSAQERRALDLIANGFTHSQAATRMGVSKSTVDTYIERIRTKLCLGNKAELVRFALGLDAPRTTEG